jgi:hypothetical protein
MRRKFSRSKSPLEGDLGFSFPNFSDLLKFRVRAKGLSQFSQKAERDKRFCVL